MLKKIIKTSASWCMPCRAFASTFHRVENMDEYKNIEFKDIDIEDDEEGETLVQKYQIRSVPTTLLLDENNEVIYKVMGNVTEKDFIMFINKALEKENEEK
jgi:thiol-disulfide isomerase/thioredoxin